MASTRKIPPPLDAFLAPPPASSLILVTSVLGATPNWLLLRFLYQALGPRTPSAVAAEPASMPAVLLISFLRDAAFWVEGATRLGLDVATLTRQRRLAIVDAVDSLYLPGRGAGAHNPAVRRPQLRHVVDTLQTAAQALAGAEVLLLIDGLDLLLATEDALTPTMLSEALMELREQVHATVIALSADLPLVTSLQSPLECDHSAFVLSIAHQSDIVMSLRMLDTGYAKDVTGVIGITVRDNVQDEEQSGLGDKELLYFVNGGGHVRVFERGQ